MFWLLPTIKVVIRMKKAEGAFKLTFRLIIG